MQVIEERYATASGIQVERRATELPLATAIDPLVEALDSQRGMLLASTYDYPGRYKRWDMGFVNPPLVIEARQRRFRIAALNERGERLIPELQATLAKLAAVESLERHGGDLQGTIGEPTGRFAEEERSKQPSVFSVLRALVQSFFHPAERYLGLYGSFG
ncbi:MAG TPA: anthranilate synthase component I, partial [Polyangiaceae bacterium]|nr:anthranilate synthase component I [Polyangiaceae bacterium]